MVSNDDEGVYIYVTVDSDNNVTGKSSFGH